MLGAEAVLRASCRVRSAVRCWVLRATCCVPSAACGVPRVECRAQLSAISAVERLQQARRAGQRLFAELPESAMLRFGGELAVRGIDQMILDFLQARSRNAREVRELPAAEPTEAFSQVP